MPTVLFPLSVWFLSRSLILVTMLGVAPLLSTPSGGVPVLVGWDVFSAWDSTFYEQIATVGYERLAQGQAGANVAFFPFYPLLIYLGMKFGVSAVLAGTVINNLAFLGVLVLVYFWVQQKYGESPARWSTLVLALCPLSLFASVVYSEGVFLLFSGLALWSFEHRYFRLSVLWGSFATATRITGLALIPAFLLTAWLKKYPPRAYVASLLAGTGMMAYSLYCWLMFVDPVAFISVQYREWGKQAGIDWSGWLRMGVEIIAGGKSWEEGYLASPSHFFTVLGLGLVALTLWIFRKKLGSAALDYAFFVLLILLWLTAGDPLLNTMSIVGGSYLLWRLRQTLGVLLSSYGLGTMLMLITSGSTASLNRYAYGIISLSLALGILLCRHPRWGYGTITFFVVLLISFSARFAQHLWVA